VAAKYAYPAIFHDDETDGGKKVIWVEFPDLTGCNTQGDDLEDAALMAKDALEGYIGVLLEQKRNLPKPTKFEELETREKKMLVVADINNIKSQTRYVKATLSLPSWLYTEAKRSNLNLSGVFQEALKEKLQLR
jgi:predicted RNase H-like HicB family nuclease